jgi:hypothetical protein
MRHGDCAIRMAVAFGLALLVTEAAHAAPAPPEPPWGTVKGQITWQGKVPKSGREEYVINPANKGLKNVMVWLVDPKGALPINPALKVGKGVMVTIQAGPPRRFEPHVLAVYAKQAIVVRNPTALADGVNVVGGVDMGDNFVLAPRMEKSLSLTPFSRPYGVTSNLFPTMRSWVGVFDHPYFAVTDAEGKFEIKGAPAGKFNIIMWHEGIGWVNSDKKGKPITIRPGGTVEVNKKVKADE